MSTQQLAAALHRVETVLQRRPDMGLHDDSPALATWKSGTRTVASHANGTQMETDMPGELGGTGSGVTPGWLCRAGIAACAVTSIAMAAAAKGIELTTLDVKVTSRSDARGLFGMVEADGSLVPAGPRDVQLNVRIGARDTPDRVRALVQEAVRHSPIPCAITNATPIDLRVDVDTE